MRVIQPEGTRGSLKWIQRAVASRPELLHPPGLERIAWLSPLCLDGYAEYRDASFLRLLGYDLLAPRLAQFWPAFGPQWDALGTSGDSPVLVEAKAHISEMFSPPSQASAGSLAQISLAFLAVQGDLGVPPGTDWTKRFYQLANRIAHLWWFHSQVVKAHLVLVNFTGDTEMDGPPDGVTWEAAFQTANYALGLPRRHKLSRYIHHVYPDVTKLGANLRL